MLYTGRDFHNFNTLYRSGPLAERTKVVGFTATQIPNIEGRNYPPELSGKLYPKGLTIWREQELEKIVKEEKVDRCLLSYSDLSYSYVGHVASRCLSAGAEFFLAPPQSTMLESSKPVIAVTAVRTGCGKSQVSRYIVNILCNKHGLKCAVVRHPMPYGDLAKQAVQRFATFEDLDAADVTVEEREEYEQHIKAKTVVFAGVDDEAILRAAEKEADVVIWDGGNNDTSFFKPDLWICVADPHRAGDELAYYPGDINFRCADVIVINKANTAKEDSIKQVLSHAKDVNPRAKVFITDSVVDVDDVSIVKGKKVVLIEDGPTLTHGGMEYGAGKFAAQKAGASEIVDPRSFLKGSLRRTYMKYPHIGKLIPAMGYWAQQVKDLEATIDAVPSDAVVIATPMDLRKIIKITKPCAIVTYEVEDHGDGPYLRGEIDNFVQKHVNKK